MPTFILKFPKKNEEKLEITKNKIIVGRDHDVEIALMDTGVSKRHLLIERTEKGYQIEDLGSQNGTFVNNVRIKKGALRNRDVIRVGRIQITIILEDSKKRSPPDPSRQNFARGNLLLSCSQGASSLDSSLLLAWG